jgi:hypothetical protein
LSEEIFISPVCAPSRFFQCGVVPLLCPDPTLSWDALSIPKQNHFVITAFSGRYWRVHDSEAYQSDSEEDQATDLSGSINAISTAKITSTLGSNPLGHATPLPQMSKIDTSKSRRFVAIGMTF